MEITLFKPRPSEANMTPDVPSDIVFKPRLYKKAGYIPVLYFKVSGGKSSNDANFVLMLNVITKDIKVSKLVEVIPFDEPPKSPRQRQLEKQASEQKETANSQE